MSDVSDGPFPNVPADRLEAGPWERTERRESVRFRLPALVVREHTLVYEDGAVGDRTGLAPSPRFFFASTLTFDPGLPPLVGPLSVYGTVAQEARRGFRDELASRGVQNLESRGRERFRTNDGARAELFPYRGRVRLPSSGGDAGVTGSSASTDAVDSEGFRDPPDGGRDGHVGDPGIDTALDVAAWLALWVSDGTYRLAGGGYPEQVPADAPGDGAGTAGAFREELFALVRGVQ
jgi:hypothetical protein